MRSALILVLLAAVLPSEGVRAQTPAPTPALQPYLDLLQTDVQATKVKIITDAMDFSTEDASTFWPMYRKYETDLGKLGAEAASIMRDFAQGLTSISGESAKKLLERSFKYEQKRQELLKKIVAKISKDLSPEQAVRFYLVENQMNRLIELKGASNLPFLEAAPVPVPETKPKSEGK